VKKHVLPWLAGWLALFCLWQLLAGEWNHQEWVAGASAATLGAAILAVARGVSDIDHRIPWRAVAASWSALPQVFVDFAIVMWALARRKRGTTYTRMRVRDTGGGRAWVNYAANFSPNAYVVEIDDEHVTLHDLVRHRNSESPA